MASLVVQTSFLGDVVLTTPLIAELAARGPVDVLTTPNGAEILRNNPHIRATMVYDRRESDRGVTGFARTVSRIRSAGLASSNGSGGSNGARDHTGQTYDAAYMAQGSVRSALLVASAGVKRRIGFNTSEGRRLYTERVEFRTDRHHAERLWWLAMSQCADPPAPGHITPRLYPSAADESVAEAVLRPSLADPSRPFIVLAPGSAWGTKRWPFYPELATRIVEEFNVVVVGGPPDGPTGEAIVAQLPPGNSVNAAGKVGILASAALIGRAAALVSNDSAPQHLASAMDTPTITLYGPTVPEFGFWPLAQGSSIAGVDFLACRPCDRHGPHRCPLGHWRCMRELSSAHVFDLLLHTVSQRTSG